MPLVQEQSLGPLEHNVPEVPEPRRAGYLAEALELAQSRTWVRALVPYGYTGSTADGFAIRGTPSEAALLDAATASR